MFSHSLKYCLLHCIVRYYSLKPSRFARSDYSPTHFLYFFVDIEVIIEIFLCLLPRGCFGIVFAWEFVAINSHSNFLTEKNSKGVVFVCSCTIIGTTMITVSTKTSSLYHYWHDTHFYKCLSQLKAMIQEYMHSLFEGAWLKRELVKKDSTAHIVG